MYSGIHRGVLCFADDYDLARSDVLSLLDPTLLNVLTLLRFDGIPVTKVIIRNREVVAMSYDEPCHWTSVLISEGRHAAILDRQKGPENYTPLPMVATKDDKALFERIHGIAHEVPPRGTQDIARPLYVHPKDFAGIRLVSDPRTLFTMNEDLIESGLFGWLWEAPVTRQTTEVRVATEVPEGYIYIPPEVDPALQPPVTRPQGMKPKVYPAHMHLLDR